MENSDVLPHVHGCVRSRSLDRDGFESDFSSPVLHPQRNLDRGPSSGHVSVVAIFVTGSRQCQGKEEGLVRNKAKRKETVVKVITAIEGNETQDLFMTIINNIHKIICFPNLDCGW